MTAPRSPRDVLADVIAPWVESDADLYGYVDTLIGALDRAGWEIVRPTQAGLLLDGGLFDEPVVASTVPPQSGACR